MVPPFGRQMVGPTRHYHNQKDTPVPASIPAVMLVHDEVDTYVRRLVDPPKAVQQRRPPQSFPKMPMSVGGGMGMPMSLIPTQAGMPMAMQTPMAMPMQGMAGMPQESMMMPAMAPSAAMAPTMAAMPGMATMAAMPGMATMAAMPAMAPTMAGMPAMAPTMAGMPGMAPMMFAPMQQTMQPTQAGIMASMMPVSYMPQPASALQSSAAMPQAGFMMIPTQSY
eukprot:Filipodium_phascolosomae@DN1941_c0_g1_i2.p1